MATIKRVGQKRRKSNEALFNAIKRKTTPVLQQHKNLRDKVTATWSSRDKPEFIPTITLENNRVFWRVRVDAPAAESTKTGISVWRLLNDGTDVMRAKMTPDFERKTTIKSFTSGPGVGGMWYFSKDISYPGIKAGGWDEKANEQLTPELKKKINEAISEFNRNT